MKRALFIQTLLYCFLFLGSLPAQKQVAPFAKTFPNTTEITSVQQYKDAVGYFENAIVYMHSEYELSEEHLKLAENCLQWAQRNENEIANVRAKYYLFHYYNNEYNIPETIKRAEELINSDEFLEMKESVFALNVLRIAYTNAERYDDLLQLFPLSQQQIRKYGHYLNTTGKGFEEEASGGFADNYAYVYFKLKNYEQAELYYKKHLQYLRKMKSYYLMSSCQNNIGLSFFYQREYDSARFYYDKALYTLDKEVIPRLKNADLTYVKHFRNAIQANISSIYIEEGKLDEALPIQYKALSSSKQALETHLVLKAYYDIAKIFYFKKEFMHSLQYTDSIFEVLKSYKSSDIEIKTLDLKAKNLLSLGRGNEANSYFKREQDLSDSLLQERLNKRYIQTALNLDVEEKERQLIGNKKLIDEKEKINLYQKIGIGVLALILIGMFFAYRFNKKQSTLIKEQKLLVDKSLQQKEALLKEIHHRVKNNLQLISGLLNLQFQKHKHLGISEMINDSQKHISSIAFAHEMLYQEEDLSLIEMKKYLGELGVRLLQLNIANKVSYKISIEEISLPINYATTLGLILNELITNSLKHAFQKGDGEVRVSLSKNENGMHQFKYEDNGVGMDLESIHQPQESLGLKLIKMFAEEIDAELHIDNKEGLSYIFAFTVKNSTP